ncbi:N-hydroxyarylamine O-acetyltransferase [Vibrio chagasii]|nr:N-hydroxyarylamine O-acetyltransferase [Vibrio chagasii]CAH7422974.1 N-hydroxyarylamine O-acetyltransferase [Vibrio chagasii]CAH7456025.1 N-hydroxyarylamine O-acetyltransferase [Vibrio chagasii]
MEQRQITEYFSRIGLSQPSDTTIESLTAIHKHQHRTIPFENFDVVQGLPIQLSQEVLHEKLVVNQRGGYCQELNGLLLNVLTHMGFEARALLGRVHLAGEPTGRSHRVTLVTIEGKQWLVDAGFGTFTPRAPLLIETNIEQSNDLQTFRFIEDEQYGFLLQIKQGEEWMNVYSLDMTYVGANDLESSNFFTSNSPKSIFTSNCIAALPIEGGIVTLLNQKIKISKNGSTEEWLLEDEPAYLAALQTYFGLVPNVPFQILEKCF